MVSRLCRNVKCQNPYEAEARYLNRGQGQFCSQSCANSQINSNRHSRARSPNVQCAYCGVEFYKSESKKKNSKSGLHFCCRDHKDRAQRIGGIAAIQPKHYGKSNKYNYRDLAFRNYPALCARCGYSKHPEVLEVNHIDCDRSNNNLSNLEILCPTCHKEYHFTTKTGNWSKHN